MAPRSAHTKSAAPRYTEEFKRRAVELLIEGRHTLAFVQKELGVSVPTLIKWKKEAASSKSAQPDIRTAAGGIDEQSLRDRLRQLTHELERVTEERDRLRKSMACLLGQ